MQRWVGEEEDLCCYLERGGAKCVWNFIEYIVKLCHKKRKGKKILVSCDEVIS